MMLKIKIIGVLALLFLSAGAFINIALATHTEKSCATQTECQNKGGKWGGYDPKGCGNNSVDERLRQCLVKINQCHSSLEYCGGKFSPQKQSCDNSEQCAFNGEEYFCVDPSYKAPLMGVGSSYKIASQQCKDDMNKVINKCQASCPSGHGVYDKCFYPNDPKNKDSSGRDKAYSQIIAERIAARCKVIEPPPPPPPPTQCKEQFGWKCAPPYPKDYDDSIKCRRLQKPRNCSPRNLFCVKELVCQSARGRGATGGLFGDSFAGYSEQGIAVNPCDNQGSNQNNNQSNTSAKCSKDNLDCNEQNEANVINQCLNEGGVVKNQDVGGVCCSYPDKQRNWCVSW